MPESIAEKVFPSLVLRYSQSVLSHTTRMESVRPINFLPKFIEETIRVGFVKASIIHSVHASFHAVDANLFRRRAHDSAMLLVSQVHSFVRLTVVPLPKNPCRGKSRRRMCSRNGREWTDEERTNDYIIDNVTQCEERRKAPDVGIFERSHDAMMQEGRWKEEWDVQEMKNSQLRTCA